MPAVVQIPQSSADPHRQLDIVAERHRQIAVLRRAHVSEIVGAEIGIVGNDERAGPQPLLDECKHLRIQRLRTVEQQQVDRIRQIGGQRTQRIALANLDEIGQPGCRQVRPACTTFDGSNSLVTSRPPPLSRSAAARCSVEMPNDVPNSTTDRAPPLRASMYSSVPVSRDTASG